MNDNLKDILSHLNPDVDQATLLLYLQGKLSSEQQHELEKKMIDSDFDADALDGLQSFKNKREISSLVTQLNQQLKKQTEKKKRFREKLKFTLDPWLIVAIVLILLIAVIGYVLVHKTIKH
ncbi:MAG: hypothetical protein ACJ749_06565 [Flavisolibacter sp.]